MSGKHNLDREELYIAVSPMLIRPWVSGRFAVYLRHKAGYVLYTNKGQAFTNDHRNKLSEINPASVYIQKGQKADYEYYLRENLDSILMDEAIPMEVRSKAWYQASISLVHKIFDEKLPKPLKRHRFSQIKNLVRDSVSFFTGFHALPNLIKLVSKGYQTYSHSMATMVLTNFLLHGHPEADERLMVKVGIGALLHDMGKASLPQEVLGKPEEKMSAEERELYRSHPSLSVGLCMQLPLSIETHHCILFHHELENGRGFPSGLRGEAIPSYLKALILANAYDQLTRSTVWRPALKPYEALQRIDNRRDQFDGTMFKRLINILSSAEVLDEPKHGA